MQELATRPATEALEASRSLAGGANRRTVALVAGDGIGPEITRAVRRILEAAGAGIDWVECEAGEAVFSRGIASGLPQETIDAIARHGVLLKGPLATPVGSGGKSVNVTLRKLFETYANVRPARELPGVPTPYAGRGVDFVVVRENVEDLYAGIEHMQSADVAQALKIVTREGSDKVARLAFELARSEGRESVHCATKANILKLTEGLFKSCFEEAARDYPGVRAQHIIVDDCAHQLVMRPEQFEVVLATNLHGDILSDLASGLVGGLGFAPSASYGDQAAIFEAVHGTAPAIAGRDMANPTALLLSAVMMLRHLGLLAAADRIEGALLFVLERGTARTADFTRGPAVGTQAFADAVIAALGNTPNTVQVRSHRPFALPAATAPRKAPPGVLRGIDLFVQSRLAPAALAAVLEPLVAGLPLRLKMISNRGVQVHPSAGGRPALADVYRCRFVSGDPTWPVRENDLLALLHRVARSLTWVHAEKLQEFAGKAGYTLAQGES
jgi:isocitrate dehydrogenase